MGITREGKGLCGDAGIVLLGGSGGGGERESQDSGVLEIEECLTIA
jgi:hypothetical protein